MNHKEALDLILSHACGGLTETEEAKNEGYNRYVIEVHCARFEVIAKCISKPPQDTPGEFCYDIRSVEIV